MSILTVTDVPDEVVAELQRRAAAHGVSVVDEARRALEEQTARANRANAEGFKAHLLAENNVVDDAEDCPDWIFDRHDLRYGQPLLPPGEDFKAHLLALGDIGPDIRLDWPRTASEHRTIDL